MSSCTTFFLSFGRTLAFMLVLGLTFVFWNQVFLFFVKILVFGFCLVNCKGSAYLAVDHNLLYSRTIMFVLILSLTFGLILGLKSSFSIHISVLFSFSFCSWTWLDVEFEFCYQFYLAYESFFSVSDSQWILTHARGIFLFP